MIVQESVGLGRIDHAACIKALFRQARRYHFASLQDRNPAVAARHNGYAIGILGVLKDLATEGEVKEVTGESLNKLYGEAIKFQDKIEAVAFRLLDEIRRKGISLPGF